MVPSLRASLARFRGFSRNAWLYLISNTMQAFTAGAAGVVYTLFLNALGYGLVFIGATLFIATAGGALAIMPASALTRRFGWRTMLLWSNYIGGAAIFLQLIAPTRVVTLVTALGIGASVAIFLVLNGPFLAACCAPDQRNAIFGLNNALGWLAAVSGALVGGLLPIWLGQLGGPGAPSGPLAWLAPTLAALRPYLLASAEARTYQVAMLLSGAVAIPSIIPIFLLRDMGGPPAPEPRPETADVAPGASWRARLAARWPEAREIATGLIGRFSLSQALLGLGAGIVFPYLSIYFVDHLHATTYQYGALTSAVTASLAVVSLISAPLADRFGQMRLAIWAQALSLPFMVLMGAAPVLWVVAAAYILRTALINTGSAPEQAWLMDTVPPERHVLASNVYNASWQGFWAVGAALGGALIPVTSYALAFYLAAGLYTASVILMILWLTPRRVAAYTAARAATVITPSEETRAAEAVD